MDDDEEDRVTIEQQNQSAPQASGRNREINRPKTARHRYNSPDGRASFPEEDSSSSTGIPIQSKSLSLFERCGAAATHDQQLNLDSESD